MSEKKLSQKNGAESSTESTVHLASALNLTWSFGVNKHVPVLNLSNSQRKALFFTTAHTGVSYDFVNNTEVLYQGHCNSISCTTVSIDKRWLATADIGRDCMLIVWDTVKNAPIKTIFDVDHVGITTMAFSSCAKFIATLSCTLPQTLCVWDWTTELETPIATLMINEQHGIQSYISFNADNVNQLVSNNGTQVIFYKWDRSGKVDYIAPELNDKDFNKTVGIYSQSVFQPGTENAFTATDCGNIVVWCELPPTPTCGINRKAFKIVKLQDKSITVLRLNNNLIVTGDMAGNVKFFDMNLKLINWYNKLNIQGSVNSISFTHTPDKLDASGEIYYPAQSTLDAKPFIVPDFSISTSKAQFLYLKTHGSHVEFRCKEHDEDIKAIACHPTGPYLAVGGYNGLLQVRDFETKTLLHSKHYTDGCISITCVAYSCCGNFLAVGFEDGRVRILDSVTLATDETDDEADLVFNFSHEAISRMVFSADSKYLACADLDRCVVVFESDKGRSETWSYLGKHRAHYKQIQDLMFTVALDDTYPRLMSIGRDRMLIEYDLHNSSVDNLKVLSTDRIEQDGEPISIVQYPSVVKEDFLCVANNQRFSDEIGRLGHYVKFKLKLFNSTTKMCRHTFLGPTYGSPIQRISVLPNIVDENPPTRYMAYITSDKVGLLIMPLDGNPFKSVALIAHPGNVHNLACSYDGQYLFTAGGSDTSVLMWKVDTNALEAAASLGGKELIPFYSLLEGGCDGELLRELKEYFYHAQIRNQGVDSMSTRNVSTGIQLAEIPYIMRALGFYPTEQQIDEMVNEVKFSQYVTTGNYVDTIDLATLIKLYVNHRPAFGLSVSELTSAFEKLGCLSDIDDTIQINRSDLLHLLHEKGEHMSESELAEYITILLLGPPDMDDDQVITEPQVEQSLDKLLPENISAEYFTQEVLGFNNESSEVV